MNKLFARWLPCLTLLTWSAVMIFFSLNGKMKDLLAPQFRIYAAIAGGVLALLALIFLFFPADASCCSAAECGHSLSRYSAGRFMTFAVLLLPVIVCASFVPQGF